MKKTLLILTLISSLIYVSCSSNDDDQGSNDSIVGIWTTTYSDGDVSTTETLTFTATTFLVVGLETEGGEITNFQVEGTYQLNGDKLTATFTEDGQQQTQRATYTIDGNKLSIKWDDSDSTDVYTRQ